MINIAITPSVCTENTTQDSFLLQSSHNLISDSSSPGDARNQPCKGLCFIPEYPILSIIALFLWSQTLVKFASISWQDATHYYWFTKRLQKRWDKTISYNGCTYLLINIQMQGATFSTPCSDVPPLSPPFTYSVKPLIKFVSEFHATYFSTGVIQSFSVILISLINLAENFRLPKYCEGSRQTLG